MHGTARPVTAVRNMDCDFNHISWLMYTFFDNPTLRWPGRWSRKKTGGFFQGAIFVTFLCLSRLLLIKIARRSQRCLISIQLDNFPSRLFSSSFAYFISFSCPSVSPSVRPSLTFWKCLWNVHFFRFFLCQCIARTIWPVDDTHQEKKS